jgi:hypothetical protein
VAPAKKEFTIRDVKKKEEGQEELANQALGYLKNSLRMEWKK